MKQTLVFLITFWAAAQSFAQVTVLKPYSPNGTQSSPAQSAPSSTLPADPQARRAAAVSKVQSTPTKQLSAKGAAPAQYSTDGTAPAQYSTAPNPATTMTVNGLNVQRAVRKGKGQVGNDLFTPISELHYVQFAVYCKDTPVDKAPAIDGLFLLWHAGSLCPSGEEGASYIVKGYTSADEAKAAVLEFKAQKIDCWYNPALTGAEVEVIGVR